MKPLFTALLFLLIIPLVDGSPVRQRVNLEVPLVAQGKMLCGPATIEMLFRYWGVDEYNQYDIARAMLAQFPDSIRYNKSGILDTDPVDWDKYPGTAIINMRDFLKRYAKTDSFMLEYEPVSEAEKISKREELFSKLRWYVSNGIPVIVHQYRELPKSRGHYRIVTGYDEANKTVYLNDANGGKRIIQSYEKFLTLWNVNQQWLHYNAIAFNIERRQLHVEL